MRPNPRTIRLDLISDVVCPWCVIGYRQVLGAVARMDGAIQLDVHWHPFELNPAMPPQGQDLYEHVRDKYGATPESSHKARARITALGADLGFAFAFTDASRIVNTFQAHQLLHWAGPLGRQTALSEALFAAYFTRGQDVSDTEVLLACAEAAGLDRADAGVVLSERRFANQVRAAEQVWSDQGITAVPTLVFEGRYLIAGAQSLDRFAGVLAQVMATPATR